MLGRYFRRLGWLGALAAILVVAGAVLAAFKTSLGPAALILLAVVPLIPKALKWIEEMRKEEKGLLRINRPISEVDAFGERLVFRSALAEQDYQSGEPAYIPRDVDPTLREVLRTKPFVLLTGTSKAGKSRTAFEAARSMKPEPTLLVPGAPDALPKLLELGLPVGRSRPAVLWLDDLERYLQGSEVSRTIFEELGKTEPRVVVLATTTLTAYHQLHSGEGEIGRSVREILDLFEEIYLPNDNSPSELEQARRLYPSQGFTAGIGEHFASARELVAKFKPSREANPHGFALVVAALDWRRAGMSRAITEDELRDLYAKCLEHFHPLLEPNDEDYQEGLKWARHAVQSRAALLMPVRAVEEGVGGFQIFDYVRDWVDSAGSDVDPGLRDVLDSTWGFVLERAAPAEAFAIGFAAYTRDEAHRAEGAWRAAADSGDPDWAPVAAFSLGKLLSERGRPQEAEGAYQLAIDSGRPDRPPIAAVNLGNLLSEQGRPQEAEEAYKLAIDSGHVDAASPAAYNLGLLLLKQGRPREAEEAYQLAIDSGHPDRAPIAAIHLGLLLSERGRPREAEEAYQLAIGSGHPDHAPLAAVGLGLLLEEQGGFQEADEAFKIAIDSEHPDHAPLAAHHLGMLLSEQGRPREAEDAFKLAIDSRISEEVVRAAEQALQRLRIRGDS